MDSHIIQSIVLGVAQGVGEFLPISSTAHLILIPYFFGWQDPGLSFDVALHLGTLIALIFCFWRDWLLIFKAALFGSPSDISTTTGLLPTTPQKSSGSAIYDKKLLWFLVIATIPGVLAGYFLESQAETFLRDPLMIAFALAFLGLALYLADKFLQHEKNLSELKFGNTLVIGLSQALAIIPGISRSGVTITAGLLQGLDRLSAARYTNRQRDANSIV